MYTDLIETFLDLCETQNFNKSAERLGITQSTVSGRVRSLEKLMDCRLFTRSRSGTMLTTEGLRFEPHARGLRQAWAVARRATKQSGSDALTMRIGIQHDLVVGHVGDWIGTLRDAWPQAAFYVESDYSTQICSDVMAGDFDIGIVYTPRPNPDLHFETLGDLSFQMVSTDTDVLSDIDPRTYILANYSPAFSRTHSVLLPQISVAPIASGQQAILEGLLLSLGGTTYLLRDHAQSLVSGGKARFVSGAPSIAQSVYSVMHLRNRHRRPHRRTVAMIRSQIERTMKQQPGEAGPPAGS